MNAFKITPLNVIDVSPLIKNHYGLLCFLNFLAVVFYANSYKTQTLLVYIILILALKYASIKQIQFSLIFQFVFYAFFLNLNLEPSQNKTSTIWIVEQEIPTKSSNYSSYNSFALSNLKGKKVLSQFKSEISSKLNEGDTLFLEITPEPLFLDNWPKLWSSSRFLWLKSFDGEYKHRLKTPLTINKSQSRWIKIKKKIRIYLKKKWDSNYEVSALFEAAWLANKVELDKEVKNDFSRLGLAHLLAISGFHINLLSICLILFIGILPLNSKIQKLLELVFLWTYVAFIGIQPSVLRSTSSRTYLSASQIFEKRNSSINFWCLSFCLSLLFFNRWFYHPGFWLSYLASGGLLFFFKPYNSQNKIASFFINSLKITLITSLCCFPALWFYWGKFSLAAFFANLYALPIVSILLLLALLALSPFHGEMFLKLAQVIFDYLGLINNYFSAANWIEIELGEPTALNLSLYVLCFTSFRIWLSFKKSKYFLISSLLFLGSLQIDFNSINSSSLNRLWFFDVGQGDATLIETQKHNFLIDTGKSDYELEAVLKPWNKRFNNKNKAINLLVSHPDLDHYGGIAFWKEVSSGGFLYLTDYTLKAQKVSLQKEIQSLDSSRIKIINHLDQIELDSLKLNFLLIDSTQIQNSNASSIVVWAKQSKMSALFMADLEAPEEGLIADYLQFKNERISFLKVGHHGSKNASKIDFLKKIKPQFSLNSAGRNNRYNHPHPDVLKNHDSLKIPLYSTHKFGTLMIENNSKTQNSQLIQPYGLGENLSLKEDFTRFIGLTQGKVLKNSFLEDPLLPL